MNSSSLHILVLLREVTDPRPPAKLTADGYDIDERGLRRIVNPADICALEQALCLTEQFGGSVSALCVGPARCADILMSAYTMGASRCVRVWDAAFAGGDVVADAQILKRILEIVKPEVFLSGYRCLDCGDDPVPALASASLDIPYVNAAVKLVANERHEFDVLCKRDRGARQRVSVSTPCTLLVTEDSCEPRYPTQSAVLKALEQSVELWGLAELGLAGHLIGEAAAGLDRERLSFPHPNPRRVVTPDASLPAFERILALLSGGIKPREGKTHVLSAEKTAARLHEILIAEGLCNGSQ